MKRYPHDLLRRIGREMFSAAGCSSEHAGMITDHLVDASLAGHDSHGTLRMYEYIGQIADGMFDPKGQPEIVLQRACTAVVDGNGALGQIGANLAMQLAISKAQEHGMASVTLRNSGHIGRVGAYTLLAAEQNLIGLVFANAGRLGRQITPYGGIDGKLSTNPISFAAPRRDAPPILVDMTTSVVAEGKVRVASNQGRTLPIGWIIDHHGQPATDPGAYVNQPAGAILPLGGVVAYKGYCLSILVELLGGALSGEGCAAGEVKMRNNGVMINVYSIEHFTEMATYFDEVETLVQHIYTSRVDPEIGEIMLPGEPEWRAMTDRTDHGIPIDDTTWSRIGEAARTLGLDPTAWNEE